MLILVMTELVVQRQRGLEAELAMALVQLVLAVVDGCQKGNHQLLRKHGQRLREVDERSSKGFGYGLRLSCSPHSFF